MRNCFCPQEDCIQGKATNTTSYDRILFHAAINKGTPKTQRKSTKQLELVLKEQIGVKKGKGIQLLKWAHHSEVCHHSHPQHQTPEPLAQTFCLTGERQSVEQRALNISTKELTAFAREV